MTKRLYIMSVFLMILALCWAGASFRTQAEPQRFFSVIQDVPLMPGLSEMADQAVMFDKPGGRFAESLADMGDLAPVSVAEYYARSLPQFGWQKSGENRYIRGHETLILEFEQSSGRALVRVSLSPL